MKKTIICSIPMKETVDCVRYDSEDKSLPTVDKKVRYPICSFLERVMTDKDEFKVILLLKSDKYGHSLKNMEYFKQELDSANSTIGASIQYVVIDTEFVEARSVHEQLMGRIVDELEDGTHILADITYGPKDIPIVIFTALNFAEKFLNCTVDNIVYGQAKFIDGHPIETKICDMGPLYCLGSVTNTIRCNDSVKARTMLKSLLSL